MGGMRGAGGKGPDDFKNWESETTLLERREKTAVERDFATPHAPLPESERLPGLSKSARKEIEAAAADYDNYYAAYDLVTAREARRAVQAESPVISSIFRPLLEGLRKSFGLPGPPAPWMRAAVQPGVKITLGGRDADVIGVDGKKIRYQVVEWVNGRRARVERTAEVTDADLAHNFADIRVADIRPTENGLSAMRLDAASDYLNEPVRVFPHSLPDGTIEYYALDGHHRLLAAAQAGLETVRVQFVHGYGYDSVMGKLESPHNPRFPVPKDVLSLEVDPLRIDDYQGGPLGEMIYGPHYYYGRSFYESLPVEGGAVDGVTFFPPLDVGGKNYFMSDGGELSFSGRIFSQDSEATAYEAVMRTPVGEKFLVAVRIRDHGSDPVSSETAASEEIDSRRRDGDPSFLGDAVVEGMTAVVQSPP